MISTSKIRFQIPDDKRQNVSFVERIMSQYRSNNSFAPYNYC